MKHVLVSMKTDHFHGFVCINPCPNLQLMGVGSMAQMITSKSTKGDYFSSTIAFALATTFAMYICGGVSGTVWQVLMAHLFI